MGQVLAPSDVLRALMHKHAEDLKKVRGQKSLGRCFDCGHYIPRHEFPMRCPECSGPTITTKVYPRRITRQDAMICIRCVDKHDHLKNIVIQMQQGIYDARKHLHPETQKVALN